jgi:recombination protein RecA
MDFLKDFDKVIDKMDGVSTDTSPPKYWFSSGNHVLNKVVSGDFNSCVPQGRVVALAGPSGSGKSYLLANMIKNAQLAGAYVLVLDSEGAFDDGWAAAIGIDVTDPNYKPIQVCTIPQVVKIVSTFIKGYRDEYGESLDAPKVFIALDSCDMLMTDSEQEKYTKGNTNADQGQHPKQLKQMLKTFTNDIKSLNISMAVTKQVYAANQEKILKGEGLWVINDAIRYSTSLIILVTRLKLKNDKTKAITGVRMKCEGFKTRFTKPFQTVTIEVPYDTGMDKSSGLLEVAEQMKVITKKGGWYYIDGNDKPLREADLLSNYFDDILAGCIKNSKDFDITLITKGDVEDEE